MDRQSLKQIEDKDSMNEAYKGRNLCPYCGMDIDEYRDVLPDGGKTCEEILNETVD